MLPHGSMFILSAANQRSRPEGAKVKYLHFRTVQRFFTFVQKNKFAYCVDLCVNCYIIAFNIVLFIFYSYIRNYRKIIYYAKRKIHNNINDY